MCALADSKWIVSFAWIEQCLRTKSVVDEVITLIIHTCTSNYDNRTQEVNNY